MIIIIIITIQLCSPTLTVKTDTRYTKPISNDRTRPPTACTPVPTYYTFGFVLLAYFSADFSRLGRVTQRPPKENWWGQLKRDLLWARYPSCRPTNSQSTEGVQCLAWPRYILLYCTVNPSYVLEFSHACIQLVQRLISTFLSWRSWINE